MSNDVSRETFLESVEPQTLEQAHLIDALLRASAEVQQLSASGYNKYTGAYSDEQDIKNAIKPVLQAHGILIRVECLESKRGVVETAQYNGEDYIGTVMVNYVWGRFCFTVDNGKASFSCIVCMDDMGQKNSVPPLSGCLTTAWRHFIMKLFCLDFADNHGVRKDREEGSSYNRGGYNKKSTRTNSKRSEPKKVEFANDTHKRLMNERIEKNLGASNDVMLLQLLNIALGTKYQSFAKVTAEDARKFLGSTSDRDKFVEVAKAWQAVYARGKDGNKYVTEAIKSDEGMDFEDLGKR